MKALLDVMNHELKVLNNTRINDFGVFHKKISELITPLLPAKFKYGIWTVHFSGLDVFKLSIDFIDDKGTKYKKRGRLVKCWFDQILEGETIPEIEKNIMRQRIDMRIEDCKQEIEEYKIELENCELELEKLLQEKASWDK